MFALQDGGHCSSSPIADSDYDKQGPSSNCQPDGKGGPGANQVYKILNRKF